MQTVQSTLFSYLFYNMVGIGPLGNAEPCHGGAIRFSPFHAPQEWDMPTGETKKKLDLSGALDDSGGDCDDGHGQTESCHNPHLRHNLLCG